MSIERESSMCVNARERANSAKLHITYLHMCRQYMCVCVCVCACVTVVCVCVQSDTGSRFSDKFPEAFFINEFS